MRRLLMGVALTLAIVFFTAGGVPQFSAHQTGSVAAHTPIPTAASPSGNQSEPAAVRELEDALLVNENENELPPGCQEVTGTKTVTVRAGREYAEAGEMFGFDTDVVRTPPCTLLSVIFVNEDSVRHQWMVHGLPRETYPMGMFSIELTGPGKATGSFIVPGETGSFRVHCSLLQHEQKGMRADLVVGTDVDTNPQTPEPGAAQTEASTGIPGVLGVIVMLLIALLANRYHGNDTTTKQDDTKKP